LRASDGCSLGDAPDALGDGSAADVIGDSRGLRSSAVIDSRPFCLNAADAFGQLASTM